MGQALANIARQVDCETIRHPLGVCVGITPFNFPVMVPLWMFPVAITCGNTFVLKPSEKVPLSAVRLGELLIESGLPEGVFSIVHGDGEAAAALISHPLVRAVSFVGSTAVARSIYETGTRNGKRVQAAGGAKNHLIIMPDADLDQAVGAIKLSAFGCAGERCMAGSIAVPVGHVAEPLVEKLCESAQAMAVGHDRRRRVGRHGPGHQPRTPRPRDRLPRYRPRGRRRDRARRPRSSRRWKRLRHRPERARPRPAQRCEWRAKRSSGPCSRSFAPMISTTLSPIGRECVYGNGASIFTRSGWAARQFKQYFNAGMIGINVGVPAPMAWFPFTGWNSSFFGDLHIQGTESVQFYSQQKMTMTRWFETEIRLAPRSGLEDGEELSAQLAIACTRIAIHGPVKRRPAVAGQRHWRASSARHSRPPRFRS